MRRIRAGRRGVFGLHANLVVVTSSRYSVCTAVHLARMEAVMRAVCRDFGCDLAECNGDTEQVHLLVGFPPRRRCPRWSTP